MSPLIGLYYPFSLPLSDETLKRALLIFDQLVFIDPQTPRVRAGRYDERSHQPYLPLDAPRWQRLDWQSSERTLEPLIAAGVATYADPTPLLDDEPTQRAMTASLQADMAREETFALFATSPTGWCVLRSRIPRSTFPFLHHQYTPRVFYDQNVHQPFSSELGFHALFADGKPNQEYALPPGPGSEPDVDEEYACVVPYYLGSSLAVSLALAACAENGAIPFTDSPIHASLLKMRIAAATPGGADPASVTPAADEPPFLDAPLSADDLAVVSLDQVLDLRAQVEDTRRVVAESLQEWTAVSGLESASFGRGVDRADAAEVAGRVREAYERIVSRQALTISRRSACRLVRLSGERRPYTHLEIDPAAREFAPNGRNLQLWPRPAAASAALDDSESGVSRPTLQPEASTEVREPRRPWWNFWNRSS